MVFNILGKCRIYQYMSSLKSRVINLVLQKYVRKSGILKEQEEALHREFSRSDIEKIIIFFVPSADAIGGGIMSICRIYEETKELEAMHGCKAIICRYPYTYYEPKFCQYTKFESDAKVFFFEAIYKYFKNLKFLMVHIPECAVQEFMDVHQRLWDDDAIAWWDNICLKHINILNQNIKMMPDKKHVERMKIIADKVTQTTAHNKYATVEVREKYGVPLHHFSAYIGKDYKKISVKDKRRIVMISPDKNDYANDISNSIKNLNLGFEIITIKNMSYLEYRKIASESMFSITFGEGLDGYFVEPVWCGGVSFAVYNDEFFTSDFRAIDTVYDSYEQMLENICKDIRDLLHDEDRYIECNKMLDNVISRQYSVSAYKKNIKEFYAENYLYP